VWPVRCLGAEFAVLPGSALRTCCTPAHRTQLHRITTVWLKISEIKLIFPLPLHNGDELKSHENGSVKQRLDSSTVTQPPLRPSSTSSATGGLTQQSSQPISSNQPTSSTQPTGVQSTAEADFCDEAVDMENGAEGSDTETIIKSWMENKKIPKPGNVRKPLIGRKAAMATPSTTNVL